MTPETQSQLLARGFVPHIFLGKDNQNLVYATTLWEVFVNPTIKLATLTPYTNDNPTTVELAELYSDSDASKIIALVDALEGKHPLTQTIESK